MSTHLDTGSRTDAREHRVPAYGPVDAALGLTLFYVVVGRVTPTVVDVVTDVLAVSPSAVRFGLAAALWFVLAVTVLDQATRQLSALGVVSHRSVGRGRAPEVPTESTALGYLALVVLGGVVAAWTFGPAMDALVDLIRVLVPLDVGAVPVGDVLVVAAFFVAFGVAAWAADRLVVGGMRILAEG